MTGSQTRRTSDLQRELGQLGYELRGGTNRSRAVWYHPEAGQLVVPKNPDERDVRDAVKKAKRRIHLADSVNEQFLRWLLRRHDVPESGSVKVRIVIAELAREFINEQGIRQSPAALATFVSKSGQVMKLDNKLPATYELKGPLASTPIVEPPTLEPEPEPQEAPVRALSLVTDGKPIQLIHRFDDTIKMYLTNAGVTTVDQLRAMSLPELLSINGINAVRARTIWDFFDRGDPFETELEQQSRQRADRLKIKDLRLLERTKQQMTRIRVNTVSGLIAKGPKEVFSYTGWTKAAWNDLSDKMVAQGFYWPSWEQMMASPPKPPPEATPPPARPKTGVTPQVIVADESTQLLQQLREALAAEIQPELAELQSKVELAVAGLEKYESLFAGMRGNIDDALTDLRETLSLVKE